MASIRLRGMTWSHPRGYDPMVACSALYAESRDVEISWDQRSLQDFESYPIEELARTYDLIVIDHPHVGQVAREGCLVPLDQPGRQSDRADRLAGSVGLSYHSYIFAGRLWALPVDAATQVQAWRPDRLSQAPQHWHEVIDLAREGGVALPLRPPHSLMCVMTLAANLGWAPGRPGEDFLPRDPGDEAIERLAELVAYLPESAWTSDPIAVLDGMTTPDGPSNCPLVYGYVSYSLEGFRPYRLQFGNIPCLSPAGPLGSVLGGTGIAVSAYSHSVEAAVDFAYWITSAEVQRSAYAAAGGQPGHAAAWSDPDVDKRASGFFTCTRATLEGAMLRPRHDGYMAFQATVSDIIARRLRDHVPAARIRAEINSLYA